MSDEKRLRQLLDVFLEENTKLNLSALRTPEACWIGNILDSLALLDVSILRQAQGDTKLLDIGTGGGFPLLPIAIERPDWSCVGLDSIKKKIDAIGRIAQQLNLTNIELIADRAESLAGNAKQREQYDVVTSRAVAPLNILLEYCAPFVKVGGFVVLWKSLHCEEELKQSEHAQQMLHCPLTQHHRYALPRDFGERQLLVFTKQSKLDASFPRAVGEAKKNPL